MGQVCLKKKANKLNTMKEELYYGELSSKILEFTTAYHTNIICKIIDTDRYVIDQERFFFTVMHKTLNTLDALNIFLRNYERAPRQHSSLFILLRAALSDVIVSEYVIISNGDKDERAAVIKAINMDHIEKTFNSITKIYAKINRWDEHTIDDVQKGFIKENSQYFGSDNKLNQKSLRTSAEKLINTLLSQKPVTFNFDLLKEAFHFYDIFSKYEHLGALSFDLLHSGFHPVDTKRNFEDAFCSIHLIMSALINYCNCWDILVSEIPSLNSLHSEVLAVYRNNSTQVKNS